MRIINALLLSAVMFAALGAPLYDTPTDSPAGDHSGEEAERPPDLLSAHPLWGSAITTIRDQQSELEKQFPNMTIYLLHNQVFTAPEGCPSKNFSKHSCLHRVVQGLQKYKVLLRHMETECSCSAALSSIDILTNFIKGKMKNSARVKPLSEAEEQQLLKEVNSHDAFRRKLNAYIILHHLWEFVKDAKVAIARKELQETIAAFSGHHLL